MQYSRCITRSSLWLSLVLLVVGALSCKSAPAEKITVNLVLATPFNTWQTTYAVREGIVTSDKVDLNIQLAADGETQLLAGKCQMVALATSSFALDVKVSTIPLVAVSTMVLQTGAEEHNGVALLCVKAGSSIKSPADLVGKTVGVPGLTSSTASVFLSLLKQKYGIEENQLVLVDKANPLLIELLRGGSLDAAVLGMNTGVQASLDPAFSVLWNLDSAFIERYGAPCVASLLVVNGEFLAEHPDAIKETLALLKRSAEYGDGHVRELAEKYALEYGQTADFYELIYKKHSMVSMNPIEGKTLDSIMAIFQCVKDRNIIEALPDPAVVFKKI